MYEDEKEEKEEKIASFAANLQKDKGKAPQQSTEENKPSGKPEESNQSPFVVSFKSSKPLVITTKAKKTKQKTGGKFVVLFVSIIQDTDSDSETEDDASSSQANAQQVQPALTPLEAPADIEDPASATFIVPTTTGEEKLIFFHRSETSSSHSLPEPFQNEGGRGILTPLEHTLTRSQLEDWKLHHRINKSSYGLGYDPETPMRQLTQRPQSRFADQASTSRVEEDIDLPGYLFEELPDKDPGSSSISYDFSDDEEELSDDTGARFFDLEEPSSPKEVSYFDPVSVGDWDHLITSLEKNTDQEDLWIEADPWSENALGNPEGLVELEASENIAEEPPSNLPTEDSVQKIDLGTPDNPRLLFISKNIKDDELPEYVSFLREFVDYFAWSYAEMPGLDPKIAVHKLNLQENIKPVKQGQRRFRPDVMDKIEQEVPKLKKVGFIREEQHPEWLANIVPVTTTSCIDYRDLNNACPKDEFPLPIPEVMIDNTCGFEQMTFMDGFSGYNQIKMHPKDEGHTSFRTPFGMYCYTVMPFGLKNAGATYQRAVMKIFQDIQHKTVKCYVDDLAVKSKRKEDHLQDLREVFLRLRKHKLRMNPLKCFFSVSSGKFLGFIVRKAGIELDPIKVKAILEMLSPRTPRELKGLQGRLAYIRRFISNLSGKCRPFSRLMKKGVDFVWDTECEAAFQDIKSYLTKPPVLAAPTTGKPFILYTRALDYSLGALLAQENDIGKEDALYYLSRMLVGAEYRYSLVEKECLAVMFAVQKLRHYLLSNTVYLILRINLLKVLVTKAGSLNARLAKWSVLLSQFDIRYVPQKAIKGQALADFLVEHPLPKDSSLRDDLLDEPVYSVETSLSNASWNMYFDGATRTNEKGKPISGFGILFVNLDKYLIPHAFSLLEPCSNNAVEYQALIIGLELTFEFGITMLEAFGNSQLIVNQMSQEYEIRKPDLLPYYNKAQSLRQKFDICHIAHTRRGENIRADALAGLAASMAI
ncbi:hypothetical protein AAC387_Pa01g2344 [Persea americana]